MDSFTKISADRSDNDVKRESTAKLVRIFLGESDRWKGQPLYIAIVEAMRAAGLAGATVFKGIVGYGAHSVVHAARIVDLSSDLPIVIELVDTEEKVEAFLPTLDEMVSEGLVTIESVRVIAYKAGEPK
jgi:PII-like signaling protein